MKFGVLSDHFEGVGAKYLTAVEIDKAISNQHEFQGVSGFREFLGTPVEKVSFDSTFLWLTDDDDAEPVSASAFCTWSDVRRKNPDRAPEFHLYYSAGSETVVRNAQAGDLLLVAKHRNANRLTLVLCPSGSTLCQQLLWLFGLDLIETSSTARSVNSLSNHRLGYAARAILDALGLDPDEPEPDAFGRLVDTFGLTFPPTAEFSRFARETTEGVDATADPDAALVAWMDHEEALFRYLERQVVSKRLAAGFTGLGEVDVDGFLSFSLSVQNRRKSRAGWAFGHHVEAVLRAHDLRFIREATTEKRNGPDFLFPGEVEYQNPAFPASSLTMLGAKTSCKDRWRQVLAEAHRIEEKHLITLQPGISAAQTLEMQSEKLQLIVPEPVFSSYDSSQREWLMNLQEFIELVKSRSMD